MISGDGKGAASLPNAYKLSPAGYAALRKNLVIRLSILIPLLLIGFTYLLWHFDTPRSIFRLAFIPVLICWIAYRQFKEQQRSWGSLEFDFRDGKLVRNLDKYAPLEFKPEEVTAIVESSKGITIKTNNRLRTLFISNRLSNYEAFRGQLASWAPAAPVTKWVPSLWDYVRSICEFLACLWVFGGPLYLIYTQHRAVVLPLGAVLTLSMLVMILCVRNSSQMPISTKKGIWFLLLLPVLGMLYHLL